MNLPHTPHTLVLRTDFRNDTTWEAVCDEIRRSSCEGFVERYSFVSDRAWAEFPTGRLTSLTPPPYFCLIVDALAMEHPEHPVLAIDVDADRSDRARMFRLIPAQATSFACNMNIANMDFEEFASSTDEDGVFRGFRSPVDES